MVTAQYIALQDCRAGGMFRRKDEVFTMQKLQHAPAHLKLASHSDSESSNGKGRKARSQDDGRKAYATPEDMGMGTAKDSVDVTSKDMITE